MSACRSGCWTRTRTRRWEGYDNVSGARKLAHVIPQALAAGGVVTRPTYALVGEQGPEAVIPLRDYDAGARGGPSTLVANLFLDRERLGRFVIERINEGIRRGEINVVGSLT